EERDADQRKDDQRRRRDPAGSERGRRSSGGLHFAARLGGRGGGRRRLFGHRATLSAAMFRATICFAVIRAGRGPCFCGNGSASTGPCGEIGRRARLKIEFRKECWFESGQGHHSRFVRRRRLWSDEG